MLIAYEKHENDPRIPDIIADMGDQLGKGNKMPDLLGKLAQLELTLLDWMEEHKGASKYVAFAHLRSDWGPDKRTMVKHYFIERSEVEADLKMLLTEEQKFWKYVESGRKPPLILPEI